MVVDLRIRRWIGRVWPAVGLATAAALLPGPRLEAASVSVPLVQAGNQRGLGDGSKRAFVELDRLVLRFSDAELGDTFYWAAVVMELDGDGDDHRRDRLSVTRERFDPGWLTARLPGASPVASRLRPAGLKALADVDEDDPVRPVVFARDYAASRTFIGISNEDFPAARSARPGGGCDDIVAMIGAGRLVPGENVVTVDDVGILFDDDDIPVVRSGTVEYYAIVILLNGDVPSAVPAVFSSGGITFSNIR